MKTFQFKKALKYLNKAIACDPKFLKPLVARASLYSMQNQYNYAISDLNQAIQLQPRRSSLLVKRGSFKAKISNIKGALDDYDLAIKSNLKYYKAYLGKASIYIRLADFEEAQRNIKSAFIIHSQSPEVIQMRFKLNTTKKNVTLLCKLGLKYLSEGKRKLAVNQFSKAMHFSPNASILFYYRAMASKKIINDESVLKDFSEAIRISRIHHIEGQPKSFEVLNQRGIFYAEKEESTLALNDFTTVIGIKKNFAEAYNNRGVIYFLKKEKRSACSDLKKACEFGICLHYKKAIEINFCK